MSKVFVLDTYKRQLDPVHPGRARILLSAGKAAVFKRYPFTIILNTVLEHPKVSPLRLKIDPGSQRGLPKAHWIDATCVGKSTPDHLALIGIVPLLITATGHGSRQKCNVNEHGFPCSRPKGAKKVKGFQTGDLVRAVVATGSKQGSYVGRVLVRASGSFDIRTKQGRVQSISHRFCTPIHRCDGYTYAIGERYAQENSAHAV